MHVKQSNRAVGDIPKAFFPFVASYLFYFSKVAIENTFPENHLKLH